MTQAVLNTQLYQKMFAEGAVSPNFWKSVETAPLLLSAKGECRSLVTFFRNSRSRRNFHRTFHCRSSHWGNQYI